MSDFTPIMNQEQFDAAISDRLDRERKKYEGYTSPKDLDKIRADYDQQINTLNKSIEDNAQKYANYDKEIADRDAKIKGYETASVKARIAHEAGLPYGAAEYLKGDDEKAIKASAEAIKGMFGVRKKAAPMGSSEPSGKETREAAMRSLLQNIKGQ